MKIRNPIVVVVIIAGIPNAILETRKPIELVGVPYFRTVVGLTKGD